MVMAAAYHARAGDYLILWWPPGRMEAVMKKLVFGAAAAAMLVAGSPAVARINGPSWRSDASDKAPPVLATPIPVCQLVKQRIETRHGHAVYRTLQVCG